MADKKNGLGAGAWVFLTTVAALAGVGAHAMMMRALNIKPKGEQ
jgi:hypothetical protein